MPLLGSLSQNRSVSLKSRSWCKIMGYATVTGSHGTWESPPASRLEKQWKAETVVYTDSERPFEQERVRTVGCIV